MNTISSEVLSQHLALRRQMIEVLRLCKSASKNEMLRMELVRVLDALIAAVRQHLAYEEEAVLPRLATEDAWGLVRVEALRDEHDAQRAVLVALLCDAKDASRPLAELIEEIVWFVRSFRRDMRQEEAALAIDPGIVVVNQIDG